MGRDRCSDQVREGRGPLSVVKLGVAKKSAERSQAVKRKQRECRMIAFIVCLVLTSMLAQEDGGRSVADDTAHLGCRSGR